MYAVIGKDSNKDVLKQNKEMKRSGVLKVETKGLRLNHSRKSEELLGTENRV